MPQKSEPPPNMLTLILSENLATRLALAAAKARKQPADLVAEILNRNLPHLDDPTKKRVAYT